ncbi:MAG: hypothetical protein QOJ41_1691 [Acidobacteriaceae bacterium]|nr:hypothetical protein [Acidobacteriaceae bacterium]
MAFNIFTTKRVFCVGQYHRIDHLVTCNLRGDKRTGHQQFLVGEFHFPAVGNCFDPLLGSHLAPVRGEVGVCRKYTSLEAKNLKRKMINSRCRFNLSCFVARGLSRRTIPPLSLERHMPINPRESPIEGSPLNHRAAPRLHTFRIKLSILACVADALLSPAASGLVCQWGRYHYASSSCSSNVKAGGF